MGSVSKVYFTKEITPENVVRLFDVLGRKLSECGGINVIINRIFCCLSP